MSRKIDLCMKCSICPATSCVWSRLAFGPLAADELFALYRFTGDNLVLEFVGSFDDCVTAELSLLCNTLLGDWDETFISPVSEEVARSSGIVRVGECDSHSSFACSCCSWYDGGCHAPVNDPLAVMR